MGPISGEAGGVAAGNREEGGAGDEARSGLPIAPQSVGVMRSTPRSGVGAGMTGGDLGGEAGAGEGTGGDAGRGAETSEGLGGIGPGVS